jgi:hypothetical protein
VLQKYNTNCLNQLVDVPTFQTRSLSGSFFREDCDVYIGCRRHVLQTKLFELKPGDGISEKLESSARNEMLIVLGIFGRLHPAV